MSILTKLKNKVPPQKGKGATNWITCSLVLASIAFVAVHQAYISRVHPNALYMDSLRLLSHLYEWDNGRMTLAEMWGFGTSSHRGLLTQAFLFVNLKLFSLNILLANRLTGVVVVAVGTIVASTYIREMLHASGQLESTRKQWSIAWFAVCMLGMGYSASGFELFTLDLGLPLWFKNLCFLLFFFFHSRFIRTPSLVACASLTLAGPVIVLLIGMGWSYAFVGAVVSVQMLSLLLDKASHRKLWHFLPAAMVLIAGAAYVKGGGGAGDGVTLAALFNNFPKAMLLMCQALGSTFISTDAAMRAGLPLNLQLSLGAIMVAMAIVFVVSSLARRRWDGSYLPLYLIIYGVLVAASVSYARGALGREAVMASRYYMDLYLFTIGLFWVWSRCVLTGKATNFSKTLLIALQVFLVAGQLWTTLVEWRTAPYRRTAIESMQAATLSGILTEEDANLLQSPYRDARRGAEAMRNLGVGVFAGQSGDRECVDEDVRMLRGWYGTEPNGTWMGKSAVLVVPKCRCELRADLFVPASFSPRELVVASVQYHVATLPLKPGELTVLRLPARDVTTVYQIAASSITVPSRDLKGMDQRELAVIWQNPSFNCVVADL